MNVPERIKMPASTAWPLALAFGMTLVFAGFVTTAGISILGAVLAVAGAIGWFRQVLPHEAQEWVAADQEEISIVTSRQNVERMGGFLVSRMWVPVEIHPVSAGIKGGLAGSAVMAAVAALYGLFSGNGIWYPMNLLVAGLFPSMATETARQIGTFHFNQLLVAVPIHLIISLLVGLLYGAMLPMLPRHPILLGGFVAPLLWSGLIYGALAFVNPVMNERIDWTWFVGSQFAFGIVAGIIVAVQERIPTGQPLPLTERLGVEASAVTRETRRETQRETQGDRR
jgi:hypothetical protein